MPSAKNLSHSAFAYMDVMKQFTFKLFAVLAVAMTIGACAKKQDEVAYSFVVAGDCRMDKSDTNSTTNPAGINIAQFDRLFSEVAELNPKPAFLFFDGDEIFGYEHDTVKLRHALELWRDRAEASPTAKAGIKIVAIPGNHETDIDNGDKKFSSPENEHEWLDVMQPLISGNDGPHQGGADTLATDQSQLTYSFDYHDSHFIVMNTDPDGQDSHVPVHWIEQDIAKARQNGAKHIFAIGHKPAFNSDGSMSMAGGIRTDFWAAMEAAHAEAMIGAHVHEYARFQPHHHGTWMIIAGNGGTPLEKDLPPEQQYFGFVVVTVMKSGRVIVKSYGHNVPAAGYAAEDSPSQNPTAVRDSADITWKD